MTLKIDWHRLPVEATDVGAALSHLERELGALRDLRQVRYTDIITKDYHAQPNDFVLYDPRAGGFRIFLPDAARAHDTLVTVCNVTSSTTPVTVVAHPGQGVYQPLESGPADTVTLSSARTRWDYLFNKPLNGCVWVT